MNKKQFLILFLISFIPFSFYFLRWDLQGHDSYYYANFVCKSDYPVFQQDFVEEGLFSLMPCDFFLIKVILFVLFFVSVITIAKLGELFNERNGWKAGVFAVGLAPLLLWEFLKFENDQFAFPLLFIATYFFFKYKLTDDRKPLYWCILFLFLGGLIWKGAIFYLIAFALSSIYLTVIAAFFIGMFFQELIGVLFSFESLVYENAFLVGLVWLFLLLTGLYGIKKVFARQLIASILLLLVNAKFSTQSIPLLAVGVVNYLEDKKKGFADYFFYIAFVLALVWGVLGFYLPPHPYEWNAIDYALSLDENVSNDWGMGYWIHFRGGSTDDFGHYSNFRLDDAIVVSDENVNCVKLREFAKEPTIIENLVSLVKVTQESSPRPQKSVFYCNEFD